MRVLDALSSAAIAQAAENIHVPYIREVIIFLIAAVMVMPLFHYIRASTVLGYLVIGALIGPHGLAIIETSEGISALGELGVVFLLFTIGLELSWTRLRAMRRMVLGLGGAQVALCGLALTGLFMLFGVSAAGAVVIGFALALSSTAIVTQLLIERGEFASHSGQISFAILLMQDLAVVPLLVMVTILSDVAHGQDVNIFMLALFATLKAVVAVVLIVTVGRYVLSAAYRFITWTRNPELFLALSLLAALLTAVATGSAGLSMALGAFLGGLLLSDTEFRHQVESDIQPFKGLLLGLFFISVGVGMDFNVLGDNFILVFAILGAFLVIKAVIVGGLTLAFGQSRICSLRTALLLASGGEFAFVVISSALADGVVSASVAQPVQLATAISMALTPLLAMAGAQIEAWLNERAGNRERDEAAALGELTGHVIVAGYGRVGRTISSMLEELHIPYVALDLDVARTRLARETGAHVYYGDAARPEVLSRLGIGRAAAIVVTLDNAAAANRAVEAIRQKWPHIALFARARDRAHMKQLSAAGATHVVHEAMEVALQLSGHVMRAIGAPVEASSQMIERIRSEIGEQEEGGPAGAGEESSRSGA